MKGWILMTEITLCLAQEYLELNELEGEFYVEVATGTKHVKCPNSSEPYSKMLIDICKDAFNDRYSSYYGNENAHNELVQYISQDLASWNEFIENRRKQFDNKKTKVLVMPTHNGQKLMFMLEGKVTFNTFQGRETCYIDDLGYPASIVTILEESK